MAVFKSKIGRSWGGLNVLSPLMSVLTEKNACLLISSCMAQCQSFAAFTKKAALTTRNAYKNFSGLHREVSLMTFHGNYSS